MANPGALIQGGQGTTFPTELDNGDLVLSRMAARKGWPVSDEVRQKVVDTAVAILEDPAPHRRLLACRVLVLADSLNVRREATASTEQLALQSLAQTTLRAALSDPAVRKQLAALAETPSNNT